MNEDELKKMIEENMNKLGSLDKSDRELTDAEKELVNNFKSSINVLQFAGQSAIMTLESYFKMVRDTYAKDNQGLAAITEASYVQFVILREIAVSSITLMDKLANSIDGKSQ